MAAGASSHLSGESGHAGGSARVLLVVGLVLVGIGIFAVLAAVVVGMADAGDGFIDADRSLRYLPIGFVGVVAGLGLAAAGMAKARRDAGE